MHTLDHVRELLETMPENRYLTASDVAAALGVHVATVIRYIDYGWLKTAGQLPGGRGRHQIEKSQVLDFYRRMAEGEFNAD